MFFFSSRRRHTRFKCDWSSDVCSSDLGHNHEIGLTRRRPENFAAETRDIITRGRGRDHFDRATGQTELERPDRILAAPVVKLLHRGDPHPLSLQLASQRLVDLPFAHLAQFKQPLPQAQTRPSINRSRNTRIAMNAPTGKLVKATANGTRKIASTSKIRKIIA